MVPSLPIQENISLAPFTTFKIGGAARFFIEVSYPEEVIEGIVFAKEQGMPWMVLGGGSNMLVSDGGYPGLVLHLVHRGIEEVESQIPNAKSKINSKFQARPPLRSGISNSQEVLVEVQAGEVWDDVVAWAVERGYWGIENLSHIPGSAGAFAVQNVGAYGAEAAQVVERVRVIDTGEISNYRSPIKVGDKFPISNEIQNSKFKIQNKFQTSNSTLQTLHHVQRSKHALDSDRGSIVQSEVGNEARLGLVPFTDQECQFGYRRSIFNTTERGRYVIWSMVLRLSKAPRPNLSYADLARTFEGREASDVKLAEIREAVIRIRENKFPFPREAKNGSAGSFFKNSVLDANTYRVFQERFVKQFPDTVVRLERYEGMADVAGNVKIPSAFLIEACGLKGMNVGGAYLNPAQPVVILNDGTATAENVIGLFQAVRREVYFKTGVILMNEPELVGFTESELEVVFRM